MRSDSSFDAPRPLAIAHRGGALLGPENTAEAFAASIEAGSTLTSVPSETLPPRGRVVCSTTRSGGWVVRKRRGTSESRDGV